LNAIIEGKRNTPLKCGQLDCMTFASEVIGALGIDVDVIKPWRGKYKNASDAAKIIKDNGGMKKFTLGMFKEFPQISLHSAKRGDVVLLQVNKNQFMGVCVGSEAAVIGSKGIELVSIYKHGQIVWGIGHK